MADDDPIDDGVSIMMSGAAAASRVAEVLVRQAQDAKLKLAQQDRIAAEEAASQLAARGEVAQAFYREAASQEWLAGATVADIRAAVEGAHLWAEIDPERFAGTAEDLRDEMRAVFGVDLREAVAEQRDAAAIADLAAAGVDSARAASSHAGVAVDQARSAEATAVSEYDSPDARRAREQAMKDAGADTETVKARVVSDRLNAHDPRLAPAGTGGAAKGKPAARTSSRKADQQRGR
ncbi:hypothetical protein ACLM5J_19765 [Nocardioides sp. Bht2]|uniref:hypothetical protein n=1 Tax=Nocardioides sp. Bht2 TaxID=3392297 RepID=UPI0039B49F7E